MSTTTAPPVPPEFVFVALDTSPTRPSGMPSDRERMALHRAWIASWDAGTMTPSKAATLDRWIPGWRSDTARALFAR
ncbi:hypothetical protein [Cellulomonas sp. ATA003]|uniref:hypothetical protein n=1 Tax=Cellulomonas sp. ATA003 TaxID=3073064 RepID=UPI002873E215|nr:hypothetical protein [Cellulomonas sp. ATA003]WNB86821.1 hypothetical protein REH70_06420 [Cellulomonas sp. ATA003]